jgi:dipeptidyl aminopeptidase/acylaminoacyl peptidase
LDSLEKRMSKPGMSAALFGLLLAGAAHAQTPSIPIPPPVAKPAALVADGLPPIPADIRRASLPYMEFRQAGFVAWSPGSKAMIIATRFGNTNQLHRLGGPGMARTQLTFEDEPVGFARIAPVTGDVMLISKDVGGNEFNQFYRWQRGELTLLTDGTSRNTGPVFTRDGKRVIYNSTRRNRADTDFWIMDPRAPGQDRMLAQVQGGGWGALDGAPDNARALVARYISVNESELHELDLSSGAMRLLTAKGREKVAWRGGEYLPDGRILTVSDQGSDWARLGVLDPATGRFTPINPESRWDVENFDLSDDGRTIAYVVNEAGASRLKLMDVATRQVREPKLPAGVIPNIDWSPWGELGFTLVSARSPADAYSLDPATLEVKRWTTSETGGLNAERFVEPELVSVKSFDELEVSGFLYRPDPARWPGKRPLLINIHGGPEAQTRPGYLGRNNYLIDRMGVAIFYPNVRGSTGYGKRFVALDNAVKREDSVKDVGAFLTRLAADAGVDAARIGVTGGSYGGYMTYAVSQHYADRIRASLAIVAISDFTTFLTNTESYRRDLRRVEYGDERDPKMRAVFERISPLRNAARIRKPLFVVTGKNDPRVPASEADQMIAAVRANGVPAWHLLAENEGHGFARKENQDYLFWSSVEFWKRHLLDEAAAAAPAQGATG